MYLYSYKELQTMEKKELLEYIQKVHREYEKLETMYSNLEDDYNDLNRAYDNLNQDYLELYEMTV